MGKSKDGGMTIREYTVKAITVNKEQTGYAGMHNVWSGFNKALRARYSLGKQQCIDVINDMVTEGVIAMIPWRGGFKLYLPTDKPTKSNGDKADNKSKALDAAIMKA